MNVLLLLSGVIANSAPPLPQKAGAPLEHTERLLLVWSISGLAVARMVGPCRDRRGADLRLL